MSGPKSYSLPPRYSMEVFNGKLNQVFQFQSRLKLLCLELEGLSIFDSKFKIQFDCKNELLVLRKLIDSTLKALVFDFKGTFGQDTYNRISGEIDSRILELHKTISKCELIKSKFQEKKRDYKSYLSYHVFYENSKISFNEFKNQIVHYLKDNIEQNFPEVFSDAQQKIFAVDFTQAPIKFDFGFDKKLDSEKHTVLNHVKEKEEDVNKIRANISDTVIARIQETDSKVNIKSEKNIIFEDGLKKIIAKIQLIIENCDDAYLTNKYKNDLTSLIKSESLNDIYFFKELHDSILDKEHTRKSKKIINEILSELGKSTFHISVQTEQELLVKFCLTLMNNSSLTKPQLDEIRMKFDELKMRSNNLFEEEEIKKKEHLFLKSQLILCLENQGYEVMDDLEVIDFEKEDDFLLKIKGQENYLNLKFKDDGSIRYVFQIPENKDDLSTDQKKLKLHEMQVTCSEFQSVLKDLSKMGLKLNKMSEKPIELNSIITVTNKHKEKVKKKTKSQQKQQFRKKYLN